MRNCLIVELYMLLPVVPVSKFSTNLFVNKLQIKFSFMSFIFWNNLHLWIIDDITWWYPYILYMYIVFFCSFYGFPIWQTAVKYLRGIPGQIQGHGKIDQFRSFTTYNTINCIDCFDPLFIFIVTITLRYKSNHNTLNYDIEKM